MRRAREWTRALADWWELQPEMVAFTGRCLVHRAEILQLDGAWPEALEEARRAGERFAETKNPAAGLARYRQGELLRLQGEFAAAEDAYREASGLGWEPQPGLAQLRLAQGRGRRARRDPPGEAATTQPLERARLLPAYVEIMLAAGEIEAARAACGELGELADAVRERDADGAWSPTLRARCTRGGRRAGGARRSARARGETGTSSRRRTRSRGRACSSREACRALGDEKRLRWSSRRRASIFERLGAKPDLARLGRAGGRRRTVCRGGSSRCCGSWPRGRATVRSRRRS